MQNMPTRHAQRYINKNTHVIVEAAQLTMDNASEISNWANGAQIVEETDALTHAVQEGLNIKTPQGTKRLSVGMFLVLYQDQFYLSQPGQFQANYNPLS